MARGCKRRMHVLKTSGTFITCFTSRGCRMACGCKTRMHDCYVFYALCACHVNGRHCAHHHFAVHGCRWGGSFVLGLGVFLGLAFLLGLAFDLNTVALDNEFFCLDLTCLFLANLKLCSIELQRHLSLWVTIFLGNRSAVTPAVTLHMCPIDLQRYLSLWVTFFLGNRSAVTHAVTLHMPIMSH